MDIRFLVSWRRTLKSNFNTSRIWQIIQIFSPEYPYLGPKGLKKWCCGDRLMFSLSAAIEIPCYFDQNSGLLRILRWNNMGSLWDHLNWTLVGHYNISFSNSYDSKSKINETGLSYTTVADTPSEADITCRTDTDITVISHAKWTDIPGISLYENVWDHFMVFKESDSGNRQAARRNHLMVTYKHFN